MKADVFKMFSLCPEKETKLCLGYKFIKDNDVVDSLLSDLGKKQCEQQRMNNSENVSKVKYIICSPLRRCLDTARIIFDTKKMKQDGKLLTISAEIRELLCCQGDFPMMVDESMENYREFDFSSIEEDVNKYGEFFFVNYLENQRTQLEVLEYVNSITEVTTKDEKIEFLIELLKRRFMENHLAEKNFDIYVRIQKFKQKVKEFIIQNNVKDGELAIVTHKRVIKSWTSNGFNEQTDEYVDCINPENACLLEVDLDSSI
jgi:broad specificity phosphatase PhoE